MAAHANIASAALKDTYTILANHEINYLSSPGLATQMRGIRNKSRDIAALVETDLQDAQNVGESSVVITAEEMDELWRAFTKATKMQVTREFFEECVWYWNPRRLKRKAQLMLRAKKRKDVKAEASAAKAFLEQVKTRRYWASFAKVVRLGMVITAQKEPQLAWLDSDLVHGTAQTSATSTRPADVLDEKQRRCLHDAYCKETGIENSVQDSFEDFNQVIDGLSEGDVAMALERLKLGKFGA